MTDTAQGPPVISPRALSDALAALGAYAEPPTHAQLAAAELAEGRAGLTARLANALYGSALAHVMTAEIAAADAGVTTGYRAQAWQAAGADAEGTTILLHYSALRLAGDLEAISERLAVDLGVLGAAADAARALAALLEICTVHHTEDPRAAALTSTLAGAGERLAAGAERIETLFTACRDLTALISPLPS